MYKSNQLHQESLRNWRVDEDDPSFIRSGFPIIIRRYDQIK